MTERIASVPMTLLLGGARSGKSRLAAAMLERWEGPVALIATAEALDQEMTLRIERHRQNRPDDWLVLEEPVDLKGAIASLPPDTGIIVDCLTLWVSNLMGHGLEGTDIEARAAEAAATASSRAAMTVVVSNEVGSGIVPVNDMARSYRDLLGLVNKVWAARADRVLLTVAGGVIPVSSVSEVLSGDFDG